MDRRGDYKVGRTVIADRRVDQGATSENLSSTKQISRHDFKWLRFTATSTQDVILPDAQTLPNGWEIIIDVPSASGASISVKTHGTTPASLKSVDAGKAYRFTCVDNGTEAGEWYINFLQEAELMPTERFVETFNSDTDWTASNGYYSIKVTEGAHGMGNQPKAGVRQISGTDYIEVSPDRTKIEPNGDITIRVPDDPDLRFAGQMVIL